MKEEIKQQIDEIRNGTIPRGYKSSVVFIPNEWNVIPLREIVAKVNNLNSGNKITEVFSNSAANGVISQRDYFEKDIANQDNTESYTIVQPDDYIYNPRISNMAPFGPIRKNKLHKTGIVSPLYTVFRQVKKDLVCEDYLELYLSSSQWYKYVYSVANQGARFDRMNITEGDLLNMPIVYPAIKEQRKIVETLSACDEIIELYKQKTEQLQILKKNLLEKMFPQYGADTPEIRFPGFTDPWEQRKYSDVIDLLSGQDYEPSAYNDERIGIPYMTGASCVIEGKTIVNRWTLTPKCIANKGDVLLVCKGSGCGTIAVMMQERAHIARQFMALKCKPGLNKRFNFYLANSVIDDIKKDARGLIAGIAREAVLAEDVCIPGMEEQYQIGELLTKLDDLITLHQSMQETQKSYKICLTQLLLKGIVRVHLNQ